LLFYLKKKEKEAKKVKNEEKLTREKKHFINHILLIRTKTFIFSS